jgi:hypothetical protein
VAYGLACLVALSLVFSLLTPEFLAGKGGFFAYSDVAQHVSGWLFFAKDSWHFPLLHTGRLNYPEGVSIVFTDSIPLGALVLKPFASVLPTNFNYLGIWLALVLVSQALAATLLIRALGAGNLVAQACAIVFSLTWPALLNQIGHTGHMTHSLILVSLAAYFHGRHGTWSSRAACRVLIGATIAGMLVNIYLMIMCFAVFTAFLGEQVRAGEGTRRQLSRLGAALALVIALAWTLGYFPWGSPVGGGFGIYSMNLLSPFTGGRLTGPSIDATGGQYEGMCYFGAGGLFLCAVALATHFHDIVTLPRRQPILLAMLLLFTVVACSTTVYFGRQALFHVDLPLAFTWMGGVLRTCGRFVWLPAYAVIFGVMAWTLRGTTWRIVVVAVLAVTLQVIDVGSMLGNLRYAPLKPYPAWSGDWGKALAGTTLINIYPSFGCGYDGDVYVKYQYLAATNAVLINTGYLARGGGYCLAKEHALEQEFAPDKLYIMPKAYLDTYPFKIPQGFYLAASRGECVDLEGDVVCRAGQNLAAWRAQGFAAEPFARFPAAHFGVERLSTQIGARRDAAFAAGPDAPAGFLAFGPHTLLYPGRYEFSIEYQGFAAASQRLGWWDALAGQNAPFDQPVAGGDLMGTDGAVARIAGEIEITSAAGAYFDVRAYYLGSAELRLLRVNLERLP